MTVPTYVFQCPQGHVTELVQSIHDDLPTEVPCDWMADGDCSVHVCVAPAARVFLAPAAIHFKGRGFYATDVKGAQERRTRKRTADDLPVAHQADSAAIARSL